MSNRNPTPTMKDVAEEAGVALGTVSKVVNGLPVGKAYQKKVETAIEKLGYRVNSYAQGLKSNKTYTVAFLVPDTLNPFFAGLTFYINKALARRNYRLLLCCTGASLEMEQSLVNMAEQNRVDGIICLSYNENLQIQEGTRMVTIDRHLAVPAPCVASDNLAGGQLAVRKLQALGCKKLLHLNTGSPLPNEVSKRKDGFLTTCVSLGIEYDMLCLIDGDPYSRFQDFLKSHIIDGKPDFDGIFCVNDPLAMRTIGWLKELGLRVPEDIQVIGYDGVLNSVTDAYPCSSIAQPMEAMAQTAVELVLSEERSAAPSLVCLPVSFVSGGTTRE